MISRRDMLKVTAGVSMATALRSIWPQWMPRLAFAQEGVPGDVLVCIFLRGGADALNMIVPFGDDNYYAARPTLAIPQPDTRAENRVLQLDDFFGLNPDMKPLHDLFTGHHLTAVHAAGAPAVPRSHFEAMDLMERGTDGESGANTGWLGRYLMQTSNPGDSPLRAIGWGENLPTSLYGYVSATVLRSIADFHLRGDTSQSDQMSAALASMYQNTNTPLESAAAATLDALEMVRQIDINQYRPANGAEYTETDFGQALKQTAALIKADIGLEVACVDLGNFDTHVTQGVTIHGGVGVFPNLVVELAQNLRAFHDDMLEYLNRVTVVTMSEFGRRVQENGAGGTDHGHGGAMLIMNDNVTETPVIAEWPGLNPDFLANGDLEITTDYRDVLGEVLLKRTSTNIDLGQVFEGRAYQEKGILK
jgi:uncharacterized protein (DUF1501 family)